MRSTIGLLLSVTMLGACTGPKVDPPTALAALKVRSEGLAAAETAQKTDAAIAFWAQDAVIQPAGMPQVEGREAIRKLYDSYFSSGQLKELKGTTSQLVMSDGGDMAYEIGVNRMVFAGEKGDLLDMGKYIIVWKKVAGEWDVVALSFTSDAAAPAPLPAN